MEKINVGIGRSQSDYSPPVELHRQLAAVTERERHVTGQYAEVTARQAPLEASLAELRTERGRAADRAAALETRLAHTTAENER